jgi:hypothetical protein
MSVNVDLAHKMFGQTWVCPNCKAETDGDMPVNDWTRWRWNGECWQHLCPDTDPQCGHFDATPLGASA